MINKIAILFSFKKAETKYTTVHTECIIDGYSYVCILKPIHIVKKRLFISQ